MDLYLILGIERHASPVEIRRAYRRLARRYHPGINPGDRAAAALFEQATRAFETLSDPERRRRYDQGDRPAAPEPTGPLQFQGFDFSVRSDSTGDSTFGDLFAEAFRPRPAAGRDRRAPRGADLHATVTVEFEQSMRARTQAVTVTRLEACSVCSGSGTVRVAASACAQCHGSGRLRSRRGHMIFSLPCPSCEGTGERRSRRCPACHGEGVSPHTEDVVVAFPVGIVDGGRVRVPGKGHAGRHGGLPGDLYVTVQVNPHPHFRRQNDDLIAVVPVAIHEAALGARIEVPTLEGPAPMRVPAGTQSGQRFRLRGRGAPSARGTHRGDLIVEIRLVLPSLIDERSKELLREFGKIHTESVRNYTRA
jgi:molecular chaperone DnaJ